jgi:hypothetical protein
VGTEVHTGRKSGHGCVLLSRFRAEGVIGVGGHSDPFSEG